MTDARAFWKQSFGFSQGRNKLASFRQFSLHEHRESANSALYVRLRETKGTKVYCTFSLNDSSSYARSRRLRLMPKTDFMSCT